MSAKYKSFCCTKSRATKMYVARTSEGQVYCDDHADAVEIAEDGAEIVEIAVMPWGEYTAMQAVCNTALGQR